MIKHLSITSVAFAVWGGGLQTLRSGTTWPVEEISASRDRSMPASCTCLGEHLCPSVMLMRPSTLHPNQGTLAIGFLFTMCQHHFPYYKQHVFLGSKLTYFFQLERSRNLWQKKSGKTQGSERQCLWAFLSPKMFCFEASNWCIHLLRTEISRSWEWSGLGDLIFSNKWCCSM